MAKKKKQEKTFLGVQDLKKLWKIPAKKWYAYIRKIAPNNKWEIKGNTIQGLCPYHPDTDPSFILNFNRCMGKCFGACGKYVVDLVQFVAKLKNDSYSSALVDINLEFEELATLLGPNSDEIAEFNNLQEMKKQAAVAMKSLISEFIRDTPDHLKYLKPALTYLHRGRNIPVSAMTSLPVGLFGKPEHMKKYIGQEYHDLFESYFRSWMSNKYWGSVCFHYNDTPGTISRFKIRFMDQKAHEMLAAFPSPKDMSQMDARALCTKEFSFLDDPYSKTPGVFGLYHYNRMVGKAGSDAYITEGEFDAISVMVAQLTTERLDFMILATGGSSGTSLSFLRELGLRTIWVIPDHPNKNGLTYTKALMKAGGNFEGDPVNPPLSYKIFQWPPDVQGSDLDEAVNLSGYEYLCRYLSVERTSHFLNSYDWAVDQCSAAITTLKVEYENKLNQIDAATEDKSVAEKNLESDHKKDVINEILGWFSCVHDSIDKVSFVQHFAVEHNIDISQLDAVKESSYSLETIDGAKSYLKTNLSDFIQFAYHDQTKNGGQTFYMWSRKKHELVSLPQTDNGLDTFISANVGKRTLDWVRTLLGNSKVLSESPATNIEEEKKIWTRAMYLLRQVLNDLSSTSVLQSRLTVIGQGIHFKELPDSAKAKGYVYFVNGDQAFRGVYNAMSGIPIEWEAVNNIVDLEDIIFKLHPASTWSSVRDVADLYSASQVDIKGVFQKVRRILDGWQFEHHDIMRDYLAAWIMALPVLRATGPVNITFLTGASTSGKTSFVKGLLGGYESRAHEVPSIIESARVATDATGAWIYQTFDQSSLLLGLDEAETQQETEHSNRVKEIQTMIMSVPTGGATTARGGATSEQTREYNVRMPIIMSGINMNTDKVFLTRVMVVTTKKDPRRKNVGDYICENFTEQEIQKLRKDITLGLLPYLPEICRRLPEMSNRLMHTTTVVPVTNRFVLSVATVLVVYEMLGFDAVPLYQNIIERNRRRFDTVYGCDFQSDVLNAVLYTEAIRSILEENLQGFTSARSLIQNNEYAALNNAECGVYIINDRGWIIIVWRQARYAILSKNASYRTMSESAMYENVAKNAYVVADITDEDHEFILKHLNLTDVKTSAEYTVLDSTYIINKETQDELRGTSKKVHRQPESTSDAVYASQTFDLSF